MSRQGDNERVEVALRGVRIGKDWLRLACPFCEDAGHTDRKLNLGVSASTGYWHCYRCGERGRLAAPPDPSLTYAPEVEQKEIEEIPLPEDFLPLWTHDGLTSLALEPARRYLTKKRNVPLKLVKQLKIGACLDGFYAGRVIVPVIEPLGTKNLGWISRLWSKPSPKAYGAAAAPYLYPKGMARGRVMYNAEALLAEDTDTPALIVEGAFDAIALYPHGVAVLGKPSHEQLALLHASKRPIVWVLDGDAWQEAWALAARMRFDGHRAGFVRLPPLKDPDELPREWIEKEARASLERAL